MEPIAVTLDKACELTAIGKSSMVKLMQDPKFPVFKISSPTRRIPTMSFRRGRLVQRLSPARTRPR